MRTPLEQSTGDVSSSWLDELESALLLTIGSSDFPILTELVSSYLDTSDPSLLVSSIRDFFSSHDPSVVRSLKQELDLIFAEHSQNKASISPPIYAKGILSNFLKQNGVEDSIEPIGLFKALRYLTSELSKVLPKTSSIQFDQQNYNKGLVALNCFLAQINTLPLQNIDQANVGLNSISIAGSLRDKRFLAIQKILYDLKSLFLISSDTPEGIIVQWNCSQSGLFTFLRSHSVEMKATAGQCLLNCWNTLVSEARKYGGTYPLIVGDNCDADKDTLLKHFDKVKEKAFKYIAIPNIKES